METLLFFTCADQKYEDFAPIYAYFALLSTPSSLVEIGVENHDQFKEVHSKQLDCLQEIFPSRSVFNNVQWVFNDKKILPNSVRFVNTPKLIADYVYIGDIDIFIMDDEILKLHSKNMQDTGLPYSNSVRKGTLRLSGLHLSRYDAYYPIPDISDIVSSKTSDELMLYEIVKRKGHPILDDHWFRPIHGIHASPNRKPAGSTLPSGQMVPGWGIDPYRDAWMRKTQTAEFRAFRRTLNERLRWVVDEIDRVCIK